MGTVLLDWSVNAKVKSKISGTLTEFAVVAAIISLPIQAVFTYLLPLLTMVVLGIAACPSFKERFII
ncbi:hypothetical protein [Halalkalibacter alkalisediminis]|uniref:Uncharacterized protein n=1 Tax=Halalkalibacter alkalisediminis TaxID=935616 RepID=A0ABV6NKN6_9BACI|nr:hypothetical protein [Halalkalibacter alkalisediminis]